MNRNDLYESIGQVEDELLERSEKTRKKRPRPWWAAATAAALLLAIGGGSLLRTGESSIVPTACAVEEASYPQMAPYPDATAFLDPQTGELDHERYQAAYRSWEESVNAQRQEKGYADGLDTFFTQSIQQFLSGTEGENLVYSPLNVYMALGMLAETTEGNSRQQILDLLGADSIETLRTQARAVWNAHYHNDGATTSILASSLWLNEEVSYHPATIKTLAETYYASSYQGKMGSDELDNAFQTWLNEQTGGLLKEQVENLQLEKDTILALAVTLFFQAKWSMEFDEEDTAPALFYGLDGEKTCDFMHSIDRSTYYWGERFGAVGKRLENEGGTMWFLLPEEGVTVEELSKDPEALAFLLSNGEWENQRHLLVNLALPKFDLTSQIDLREGLRKLGVTDVFDRERSDFSPLTSEVKGIILSQAQHDVRLVIDEKGLTAAAYTVMQKDGAASAPTEKINLIFNRPFLFAVTSEDGLPLFVGTVYRPA